MANPLTDIYIYIYLHANERTVDFERCCLVLCGKKGRDKVQQS